MILSLVLIWAEAQNLTEVKGQLGKDVTLNCSFNDSEVHWYLQIYGQFKGEIGRSLASDSIYSSTDFKTKFSILRNRLVIKNVTAEDCRLYFCGRKKKAEFHLVDTFSLTLNSSQSSNSIHHSSWRMWEPFIYPSFGLNAILVVAVMGWRVNFHMHVSSSWAATQGSNNFEGSSGISATYWSGTNH
ncbi:uncharacterized protein KZ484_019093 isoform 2-T2 [Pholidichthys leucotaenia]